MKNLGMLNILTIIFIILKVLNIIGWSWWLVLLPTIINLGLGIIFFVIFFVIAVIAYKGDE